MTASHAGGFEIICGIFIVLRWCVSRQFCVMPRTVSGLPKVELASPECQAALFFAFSGGNIHPNCKLVLAKDCLWIVSTRDRVTSADSFGSVCDDRSFHWCSWLVGCVSSG